MKRRIYLFCNTGFGGPFLRALGESAPHLHDHDLYIVHAAGPLRPGLLPRIRRLLLNLHGAWHNLLAGSAGAGKSYRIAYVPDVNGAAFAESVPPGSIGFVAGFNQIFRRPVIDRFSSFLNFHPSLLPYYRGAIPSYWVLRNGETVTGFTVHAITERIDAGEIVYQEMVPINRYMSEAELDRKLAAVGACYLTECLRAIVAGEPFRRSRVEPAYLNRIDYAPSKRE